MVLKASGYGYAEENYCRLPPRTDSLAGAARREWHTAIIAGELELPFQGLGQVVVVNQADDGLDLLALT